MRIRRSSFNSSLESNSSASCSSSPPSSVSSTSSNAANYLASSTDSSSSFFPQCAATKCQGLDLLVKAIHLVTAGSVVGVPYIQRRIVRRRRRTSEFDRLVISQSSGFVVERIEKRENVKSRSLLKRPNKKAMVLASKYQDSLLHSPNPKRRQLRSIEFGDRMGY